jgi:two-component system response regulator ChvI
MLANSETQDVPRPQPSPAQAAVVLVDDDTLFLKTFGANLERAGYQVSAYSDPSAVMAALSGEGQRDAYILDWHMPRMDGLELLNRLRGAGIEAPIMFLTSLNQPLFEEMALEHGAVEFVEKTRSPSVIIKRLELIITGARLRERPRLPPADVLEIGPLSLRQETKRARWQDKEVPLSLGEFEVVALLATKPGHDVSYREIYNTVQTEGFIAGQGSEGYRTNVRALIKRIRRKFTDVDPGFNALENYPGFGYRWRVNA